MSNLSWFLVEDLDEVMPDPRDSASAWLIERDGNMWLAPADDDGKPRPVADGQVVEFITSESFGFATLTFDGINTGTVDVPMPAGASGLWIIGDLDTSHCTSIDELIRFMLENGYHAGEYEVGYSHWSDHIPLRFDAVSRSFVAPGTTQ